MCLLNTKEDSQLNDWWLLNTKEGTQLNDK